MPSSDMTARMAFEQGRQHFSQRSFNEASEQFRNAIKADPMYHEAHTYLAECYEKLGYRRRASNAWETLLRITKDPKRQEEINQRISSL